MSAEIDTAVLDRITWWCRCHPCIVEIPLIYTETGIQLELADKLPGQYVKTLVDILQRLKISLGFSQQHALLDPKEAEVWEALSACYEYLAYQFVLQGMDLYQKYGEDCFKRNILVPPKESFDIWVQDTLHFIGEVRRSRWAEAVQFMGSFNSFLRARGKFVRLLRNQAEKCDKIRWEQFKRFLWPVLLLAVFTTGLVIGIRIGEGA